MYHNEFYSLRWSDDYHTSLTMILIFFVQKITVTIPTEIMCWSYNYQRMNLQQSSKSSKYIEYITQDQYE